MMLVTKRQDIASLAFRFREVLGSRFDQEVRAIVGYKGGSMLLPVHWSDDVRMWMAYEIAGDVPVGRFWTGLGLERPFPDRKVSITTEINFPLEGINRRVAGAFVKTSAGGILVVHRGRIGGGRHGIGKSLFWSTYRGRTLTIINK